MKHLAAIAALCASATAAAQAPSTSPEGASWMRDPASSPDGRTLVFTYKGDLYTVPGAGGAAVPLTSHRAYDFMPVQDAATNRQYPSAAQPELYAVPAADGGPTQILTTPAENVRTSADGRYLVYGDRKGGENAWRKHHTSSVARDLWLHDTRTGDHRQLTTFAGGDRNPILGDGGRALYYLGEASGTFNAHGVGVEGGAPQQPQQPLQLTRFTGVPVRFLSMADDGTLAFGWDGQLYTMAPGGQPRRVPIAVTADARASRDRVLPVTRAAQGLAVAPSGKEVACLYRGDVYVSGVDGGGTQRITSTPEAETGLEFSPDGKALVYASERGGTWAIHEARRARDAEPYFYPSTVVRETPLVTNDRQNTHPSFSPDGKSLAYLEDRNTLRVLDLDGRRTRTLLGERELFGNDHHFQWSPDGRWILFDLDVPGIAPGEVGLVRADGTGQVVNRTQSGFHDARARWILGGKAMPARAWSR